MIFSFDFIVVVLFYVSAVMRFRDATTDGLIKVRSAYPFGLDPVWHGSRSELPFLNSLKMKMSILLGVAQMNLGIIMSFFNAKFFRSCVDIWYVFIILNSISRITKYTQYLLFYSFMIFKVHIFLTKM